MTPGTHAAGDGSFGRSAGIQVGRAAIIVAIAVVIGVLLLRRSPSNPGGVVATQGSTTTSASSPATTGRTTTIAPGTTGGAAARAPQDVKVLVANGTTTSGLAGHVSGTLHGKGYNTLASTNTALRPTGTIAYFTPGYALEAAALAQFLGLPPTAAQAMPTPPPVTNLNGANILVIAGPDLAASAAATTTTKAATTSTTAHA